MGKVRLSVEGQEEGGTVTIVVESQGGRRSTLIRGMQSGDCRVSSLCGEASLAVSPDAVELSFLGMPWAAGGR